MNQKYLRYDIRQFDKRKKPRECETEISKLIDSFFILNEEGKVWSYQAHRMNFLSSHLYFMKKINPTIKRIEKCEIVKNHKL